MNIMAPASFPDLVGLPAEEAKNKILATNPNLNVIIIGENEPRIKDYRLDRVWLNVDQDGKVAKEPRTG